MIRVALRPKAAHPSRPKTPLTPRQSLLRVASWLGWPLWVWLSFMGAGLLCSAVLYLLFHGQESVPVLPLIMMQTAPAWVAALAAVARLWLGAGGLYYLYRAIDDCAGGGQAVAARL